METATPSLLELQCAMRASLVVHDDRGISAHVVDAGMSPAERLDVYRSTFASVLTKALHLPYPSVHRLVGAELFDGAARTFIAAHTPKSGCRAFRDRSGRGPGAAAGAAPCDRRRGPPHERIRVANPRRTFRRQAARRRPRRSAGYRGVCAARRPPRGRPLHRFQLERNIRLSTTGAFS